MARLLSTDLPNLHPSLVDPQQPTTLPKSCRGLELRTESSVKHPSRIPSYSLPPALPRRDIFPFAGLNPGVEFANCLQ